MNHPTVMDKDRLAAFADGELSPEEAAAVVMHLADCPQDQAYVDDLMAANAALSRAFAGALQEPVPEALQTLILGAPAPTVVPFRARRVARPRLWLAVGGALAAALAVAVFVPGGGFDVTPGPLAASSPLHQVLATAPAGQTTVLEDGVEVMVLASLPTPTGFCREVEVIRPGSARLDLALACTSGAGWAVQVVIAEDLSVAAGGDGFATASGEDALGFAPFLDRVGAGAVLSPDAEAAAIARGWTP